MRFHHALREASWSSEEARWTLEVERTDTGERTRLSAASAALARYYRCDCGHELDFVEAERFGGARRIRSIGPRISITRGAGSS
ncbi:MAG: hypothetical protein R3E53_21350 [Myxococcota bacterium]